MTAQIGSSSCQRIVRFGGSVDDGGGTASAPAAAAGQAISANAIATITNTQRRTRSGASAYAPTSSAQSNTPDASTMTPHARSAAVRFDRLAATTTNSTPSNRPVTSRAAPTAARLGIHALAACASSVASVAIHASRRGMRAIQRGKTAQLMAMPPISSAATPVAASSPMPKRRIRTPTNSGISRVPLVAIA